MQVFFKKINCWLIFGLGTLIFIAMIALGDSYTLRHHESSMALTMPRIMQVIAAGGDRFLAANIDVLRALMNPLGKDDFDQYVVQASVQRDAAWLNARHEDNYYLAAALLSWSGHVADANWILGKAYQGRPFDMLPAFYLGFNSFYFDQNPMQGAKWIKVAADRTSDEKNKAGLMRISSRWASKGSNANEALKVILLMQEQARGSSLKQYLKIRSERLKDLIKLQAAAEKYNIEKGGRIKSLEDLVKEGMISSIPGDPLGVGYGVNGDGVPVFNSSVPSKNNAVVK